MRTQRPTRPASPRSPAPLVWLYAVVDGRARPVLARATRLPDGGGAPRAVPIDTFLTAIVADVPAEHFDATAIEGRLADVEWVGRVGAAHHTVIDRLARSRAVAPFRVFTLFDSDDRVTAALAPMRRALRLALDRVRGHDEWVVRVFRPSRPAPAAAAPAARAASGTEFLRARRDGRRADAERARLLADGAATITETLAAAADEHVIRPVEPGTSALVDAAFLVRTPKASAFRRRLGSLSRELRNHGCRVTLTGPWPPYSFVTIGGR